MHKYVYDILYHNIIRIASMSIICIISSTPDIRCRRRITCLTAMRVTWLTATCITWLTATQVKG